MKINDDHKHKTLYTVIVTATVVCSGVTFNKIETWEIHEVDENTAVHNYWKGKMTGFKVA